ncbi:MAG: hypothetical protein WCP91_00085 [Candidatus Berkelbacteria bacterium]
MSNEALIPSVTHPKRREVLRNCAVGLDRAGLDEDGLQQIVHRAGELQQGMIELVKRLSLSNQFASEETASNYTYPPEYKGPKPIEEQITALAKMLDLDPASALAFAMNLPALPEGAEGWFAIPSPVALAAKHFANLADPAEQNCAGISLIHAKIAASRKFYNYREGQITTTQLRVAIRTAEALAQITETQKGDILIIAAQLGLRHRGKSVRRAREVMSANEFGLGSLMIGSIVLTHPERFVRWEQLHMDCAGDEFSPGAGGDFVNAPYLRFGDGEVRFSTYWVSSAHAHYGSASAFLPQ